jgi:hypothetical protein
MPSETYRDVVSVDRHDLVGYAVEAADGSIGRIDEASKSLGGAHVVVDTGFWIFGRKRVIPSRSIGRVDVASRTVFVGLSRDRIRNARPYGLFYDVS